MLVERKRSDCSFACCTLAICLGWLVAGGVTLAGTIDEPDPAEVASEELNLPPHPADGERGGPPGSRPGMHGRGSRFGPPGAHMWRRLSEEERRAMVEFMAEHFPERFDELADVEAEDADMFNRHAGRMLPQMMRLRDLKEEDPEAFEVQIETMKKEFQLRRLARRYRFAGDDDKKTEMERDIRALVGELFDLKVWRETLDLARLEKRLDHLRERIEKREINRDQHIDRMVTDILSGKPPHDPKSRRGGPEGDLPRFHAVPENTGPESESPDPQRRPTRRPHDRDGD